MIVLVVRRDMCIRTKVNGRLNFIALDFVARGLK